MCMCSRRPSRSHLWDQSLPVGRPRKVPPPLTTGSAWSGNRPSRDGRTEREAGPQGQGRLTGRAGGQQTRRDEQVSRGQGIAGQSRAKSKQAEHARMYVGKVGMCTGISRLPRSGKPLPAVAAGLGCFCPGARRYLRQAASLAVPCRPRSCWQRPQSSLAPFFRPPLPRAHPPVQRLPPESARNGGDFALDKVPGPTNHPALGGPRRSRWSSRLSPTPTERCRPGCVLVAGLWSPALTRSLAPLAGLPRANRRPLSVRPSPDGVFRRPTRAHRRERSE